MEKKKPKYSMGETVVVTIYGTVGKITDIKWLDSQYVYEVNKSEGLYVESSLQLLSEYEGTPIEQERLDIEYKYFFGDLVQVKGYGSDLFKITGYRTEIWRYKEDSWEDIIYELARVRDGEWLEAAEDELSLIADAEHADTFIRKLGLLFVVNKQEKPPKKEKLEMVSREAELAELERKREKKQMIDHLLDIYNDYQILHSMFQDEEYSQIMKVVTRKLQALMENGRKNR